MPKRLFMLFCIALVLQLTGCWSRREPKTLALISSALYDLNEEGIYSTTIEIINPEAQGSPQDSGDGKSPTLTVSGEGKSLPEALRKTAESLERNLFAGQTLARFYTERYAKKDIVKDQDYFLRDFLTDEKPLVIILRGDDPQLLYTATLGLSNTVGNYIDNLHRTQDNFISTAVFIDTLMFLKDYHREGKQPVAGVAQLIEDDTQSSGNESKGGEDSGKATMESTGREGSGKEDKKYKVKYEGLAAFKDERLVGYLDAVETRAYKILTNTIGNSVVSLTDGDHVTALHIDKSKASLSACAADKGKKKAKLDVKIKMDISVMQADENLDVTDFENLKALEDRFNKQIRDEVLRAIKKAQTEFKSDIFGFGNAMHADRPGEWKKFRANWDESFSDADINIRIQSSINRSGLIKKTIKNRA
ncbi:MAG: Ger(x)C family spore germination protein [Clostridiales bacterium]|jgi:spore germination protein KC|nr:Ger(x)C family spore germination protein [Clostridiales bacterium]